MATEHPEVKKLLQRKFNNAVAQTIELNDPTFAGVADLEGRRQILALQITLHKLKQSLQSEMGTVLGVTIGFNASDGD